MLAVQKEGLGLDKCVEEAKSRMARYNVVPNMLYASAWNFARFCSSP